MGQKTIDIRACVDGWQVSIGGILFCTKPSFNLALEAIRSEIGESLPPIDIWVQSCDGSMICYPANSQKSPESRQSNEQVSVHESVAVPANINGQDMRSLN